MKKLLSFTLTLVMLFTLAAVARADVIWEPENNFYERHRDECTYAARQYYANGPDGFVTLYDAPGSSSYSAQYENGAVLNSQFQYQDWLYLYVWNNGREDGGWVPLSELYLIYDYISFEEEYGSLFQPYNDEFADYDGPVEGIGLYEYPYSSFKSTLHTGQEQLLDCLRGTADTHSYISQVYYDEESGDIWGYVGYMQGYRNFWVCLNNPTGEGIDCEDERPVVESLIAANEITAPHTPIPPAASPVSWLAWVLVAAVVAVTAALLFYFYGRKGRRQEHS